MTKQITRLGATMAVVCLSIATLLLTQAQEKDTKSQTASVKSKTVKHPAKPVDINSASEKELITLPGVGPKIAKQIVASRPFKTVDDLKKVKGIGDKSFAAVKDYIVCGQSKN